ncbi:SDR family oxidoreductase [Nocardioides houyundeii]|uniref:SDR family oxidoreductase n=1 Tax=Nocardioides houyundeii TaxID=2045452 RepID=UPI000C75BA7A|nr:SDR family oxidoreductase [Nocardioides houyundeii]
MHVLVVGATGTVGRHVAAQAVDSGHTARALVRDLPRAQLLLPPSTELVLGDGSDPTTLPRAVDGVDAVVFTHGSHGAPGDAERVDYGVVHHVLKTLGPRRTRIALMTSIGVTVHDGGYNRSTHAHDWKRRAERLVRRSGHAYTIVRPGWFDYNREDERRLVFLQGDKRRSGGPSDGAVARDQIARVLLAALTCPAAERKTLELIAEAGSEQEDLDPLFGALVADPPDGYDGPLDPDTLPLAAEPDRVRAELDALTR